MTGVDAMNVKDLTKSFPRSMRPSRKYVYGAIPPRIGYDEEAFIQKSNGGKGICSDALIRFDKEPQK